MPDQTPPSKSNLDAENRTRSAYRAVSGDYAGDADFSGGGKSALESGDKRLYQKRKKITARLPMPLPAETMERQGYLRGAADSIALYRRYHKQQINTTVNTPQAQAIFDLLEQARCEALGIRQMVGVAKNLSDALEEACLKKGYDKAEEVSLEDGLYALAFEGLSRQNLPPTARRAAHKWRLTIERKLGFGSFIKLFTLIDNQQDFAVAADEFIARLLDVHQDNPLNTMDDVSQETDEREASVSTHEDNENDEETDSQGDNTEDSYPENSSGGGQQSGSDKGGDDTMQNQTPSGGNDEGDGQGTADDEITSQDGVLPQLKSELDTRNANYAVYANDYDEMTDPQKLIPAAELKALRAQLDSQLQPLQAMIGKLAIRLQRLLLAQKQMRWDYNLEDGILDTSRLTRIVVDPNLEPTYKKEVQSNFKDTVISLLIDNSGSMRGRPITVAALTTDILAKTLERVGVSVEILGYTTVNWKGGKSRAEWVKNGRPPKPGRLNDVRHIIYKSADMPLRRAKNNLGLMLKEGILKENIDGEALLWAAQRLMRRREERKILMVVSDGAPVDDSTLSANSSGYLERDLTRVINYITGLNQIELTAIGIGHDVGKYYDRAVTIRDVATLPAVMMNELAELFDE